MPIRIYALAKDLDMDSKDLVDACTKAGITGKGSALASLDDDEVAKVKSYLEGPKSAPKKAPEPAMAAPERPVRAEAAPKEKIRVIPAAPRKSEPTAPGGGARGWKISITTVSGDRSRGGWPTSGTWPKARCCACFICRTGRSPTAPSP